MARKRSPPGSPNAHTIRAVPLLSRNGPEWSWASFNTDSFGTGLVACRGESVVRVWLPNARRRAGEYLDELRFVHDAIPGAHGGFAARVAKRLEAMFRDGEDVSDIPILMEKLPPFTRRVAEECRRIPRGQVASYQDLAERAGSPAAMRAVGNAMASNRLALLIPCHRVVKADLSIGNYGGGAEMKRWLLEKEQG